MKSEYPTLKDLLKKASIAAACFGIAMFYAIEIFLRLTDK